MSKEQEEGFVESTAKYTLICAHQRKGKDPQRRFHPLIEVCLRVLYWRMFSLDCQVEQHWVSSCNLQLAHPSAPQASTLKNKATTQGPTSLVHLNWNERGAHLLASLKAILRLCPSSTAYLETATGAWGRDEEGIVPHGDLMTSLLPTSKQNRMSRRKAVNWRLTGFVHYGDGQTGLWQEKLIKIHVYAYEHKVTFCHCSSNKRSRRMCTVFHRLWQEQMTITHIHGQSWQFGEGYS